MTTCPQCRAENISSDKTCGWCGCVYITWQQKRIAKLEATLSKIESLCNQYKVLNINRYAKLAAIAGKWRQSGE